MKTTDRVRDILEPIAKECRLYVIDVTARHESGKMVLRILVDRENGVTMEECANFNNLLNELFDAKNIIENEYILEVSSPGLDRKLKEDGDFAWAVGKSVKVTTYMPLCGRNVFSGVLFGIGEKTIVIEKDGVSSEIPMDKIASAKLEPNIDWSRK